MAWIPSSLAPAGEPGSGKAGATLPRNLPVERGRAGLKGDAPGGRREAKRAAPEGPGCGKLCR